MTVDDDGLVTAYRNASDSASRLVEDWDETSDKAWRDLDDALRLSLDLN